jgi:PAS domain S-box-containing protein
MDESGAVPGSVRTSELETLRARLTEAEETLRAIRSGEVDALLIADAAGDHVYTLRSAETPYRALVEQMNEGAATLTTGGHIVYCNRRFAGLAGRPLEHVIGTSLDHFIDPADRPSLRRMIADGRGTLRARLRSGDRMTLDVHMSISTVTLHDGEHRTLIVTDTSTLSRVQRESRAKDEFLAMLGHELRNPLGAIGGAVQVIARADLRAPSVLRARGVIERQVSHMGRLVDDLLDMGRVVTGKIALDLHPLDLGRLVASCMSAMRSGRGGTLALELPHEPVWVCADAVRIEQVVSNLVSNALKFTPADRSVRVLVARDGADAVLRVVDEGIGIDPEVVPYIFDLFVQGDSTMDRAKGGLGIGLTLVRRLAELHGGIAEAFSDGRGLGTTLTVRLPTTEAPATAVRAIPAQPSPERSPKKVMLVDDNADGREMYGLLLQAEGHEVFQAEDGFAALSAFKRDRPDVAVIDIGLPGLDGYEVARRLRAEPGGATVTLIALTGYGSPEDRERSRAAGFDRHLVKPAPPDELCRAVNEAGCDRA